MSGGARNNRGSRAAVLAVCDNEDQPSGKFVKLSHLRKLRDCEQVAAVCYRLRGGGIEFLLIRTRSSRRWTFPKGSAELGLTHAQAAALEAFEEAGVHGRIEEMPFAQYTRRERGRNRKSGRSAETQFAVNAHLCEVFRLSVPKESNRERTWFSLHDAKQRLREGRNERDGAEFARVIDKAAARVQETMGGGREAMRVRMDRHRQAVQPNPSQTDALHKVHFDFVEAYGRAAWMPYVRQQLVQTRQSALAAPEAESRVARSEVLEFQPAAQLRSPRWQALRKMKALGNGT